jgi:Peptidase family S51
VVLITGGGRGIGRIVAEGLAAGGDRGRLGRYGLVWLRGGNVFMLRYALHRSGADAALRRRLRRDALVYGGYSAGPCVLGPTIRGFEVTDDPVVVPAVYGDEPIWTGMSFVDFVVVPLVGSPERAVSARLTQLAADYRAAGVPHRGLRGRRGPRHRRRRLHRGLRTGPPASRP